MSYLTFPDGLGAEAPRPLDLAHHLGDPAPVFLALVGDRSAPEQFLTLVTMHPHDSRLLHHLGLAAAAKIIRQLDQRADPADLLPTVQMLVVALGAVFANDDFWIGWWSTRNRHYDVRLKGDDIRKARDTLRQFWAGWIRRHLGDAAATAFAVELDAARMVQQAGGLPCGGDPPRALVLGPQGVRLLNLTDRMARWAGTTSSPEVRIASRSSPSLPPSSASSATRRRSSR